MTHLIRILAGVHAHTYCGRTLRITMDSPTRFTSDPERTTCALCRERS